MGDAVLKYIRQRLYIGLCKTFGKDISAFYFKPDPQKLRFYKTQVGINSLNKILPDLCSAVGIKKKQSIVFGLHVLLGCSRVIQMKN